MTPKLARLNKSDLKHQPGELPGWFDSVLEAHNRNVTALQEVVQGVITAGEQTFEGLKTFAAGLILGDNLRMSKTKGKGVEVGAAFGWRDIIGDVVPKTAPGAGTPTLGALAGANVQEYFFALNDVVDMRFHIPHDYVPGSDLHVHVHWTHNGTDISGTLGVTYYATYARGHGQGSFPAEVTLVQSVDGLTLANSPRYIHRIDEVQLSSRTPAASQLDTDLIEPDGLILIRAKLTTLPTITGGSPNRPAFCFFDLHYQSTNLGTAQKTPDFYA